MSLLYQLKEKLIYIGPKVATVTGLISVYGIFSGNETFYKYIFMPIVHILPAQTVYRLAYMGYKYSVLPMQKGVDPACLEVSFLGHKLSSPIGLPAGFDRTGAAIYGISKIGFSIVEVGTVSPYGRRRSMQKLRIDRLVKDKAIITIDKGYDDHGYRRVFKEIFQLRSTNKTVPLIGINLGKTNKQMDDYQEFILGLKKFAPIVDFIVIDLSTPKTGGIKFLKNKDALKQLLIAIRKVRADLPLKLNKIPILIKFSPDITTQQLNEAVAVIQNAESRVDGVIVCNGSVKRNFNLKSRLRKLPGTLSGAPLHVKSTEMIQTIYKLTNGTIPIVGVGGVFTGQDAYEKILAGATIVEFYTALLYYGPPVVWKIKSELAELLKKNGYKSVQEAIGTGATELRSCASCGEPISDRYFLEVGGCSWHGSCLRCCVCLSPLDRQPSCFLRERQVYCKADYAKNFGAKCSKCCRGISSSDWVRRARELVFHLACFACDSCGRQLSTGEQFALLDDRVLCKAHYLETIEGGATSSDDGCDADGYHKSKAKRVRTTFTEEQLQVLQANFQIDSNPDGQDLERIASVTGLSKRVTQVWFQNSRARQKKHIHAGKNKMSRDPDGNSYSRHINLQLTYSFQNNSHNTIHLNNNNHSSKSSIYGTHSNFESSLDELSQDSSIHCMQSEV